MIGTPPPKIWWLPPSGLRNALRNALRTVEIPVVSLTFPLATLRFTVIRP